MAGDHLKNDPQPFCFDSDNRPYRPLADLKNFQTSLCCSAFAGDFLSFTRKTYVILSSSNWNTSFELSRSRVVSSYSRLFAMVEDVRSKRINLVLVKDLSRFGCNYIQVGQYTDYLFPSIGCRFVALNDGVDTLNTDNDIMPFKNLFNEIFP